MENQKQNNFLFLLDWMLPLFFSNQTIINRLLGSSKPQIVNVDLGEVNNEMKILKILNY